MKSHYLWELRAYFRQVGGELLLGSIAGLLANTAAVLPPILLGKAIDATLAYEQGTGSSQAVTTAALFFLGATLLEQIPRMGRRWWVRTASARSRTNMRADLMRGILALPMEKLHGVAVGDLMARVIGDVDVVGRAIRLLVVDLWDTLVFSLSMIITMAVYDSSLTLMVLAPAPIALLIAQMVGSRVRKRTAAARIANSRLTAALQENLTGIRVLRLFGRSQASLDQVRDLSQKQAETNLAVVRLRDGMAPVYTTLLFLGIGLIIAYGGRQVVAGFMTVGSFVAFTDMFLRMTNRSHRIPRLLNIIQSGGAAYERIKPFLAGPLPLDMEPRFASFKPWRLLAEDAPQKEDMVIESHPLAVSIRSATFHYPDARQPALHGINLEIEAGEFVAITGPVGSGKSALLHAVLGDYALRQGTVSWDGRVVGNIPPQERSARVGYLAQDAYLFSGSVAANIEFERPHREIREGLTIAGLGQDIASFPQGMDSQIGEQGMRISGGQRQRIALARALASSPVARPGLLLLDDPFSAIDLQTEYEIIHALRAATGSQAEYRNRATILLASHRLLSFPLADRIIVLQDGRIHETGSHHELLQAGGLYAHIFQAQSRVSHAMGARL
jgi:ATP-binding cassette subfamily B multidrug efflux pump